MPSYIFLYIFFQSSSYTKSFLNQNKNHKWWKWWTEMKNYSISCFSHGGGDVVKMTWIDFKLSLWIGTFQKLCKVIICTLTLLIEWIVQLTTHVNIYCRKTNQSKHHFLSSKTTSCRSHTGIRDRTTAKKDTNDGDECSN